MTSNPSPRRKKAALILMCLAPIFALSPLFVATIAVRITPECAVVPNCAGGALAYLVVLTVPIGIVLFSVGLIMLLTAKRPKSK